MTTIQKIQTAGQRGSGIAGRKGYPGPGQQTIVLAAASSRFRRHRDLPTTAGDAIGVVTDDPMRSSALVVVDPLSASPGATVWIGTDLADTTAWLPLAPGTTFTHTATVPLFAYASVAGVEIHTVDESHAGSR